MQWFFKVDIEVCYSKHCISIYSTTLVLDWFIEKSLGQPTPLLQD